ncbi:UTP--glucose-1-phosphate uridylyltransferase [Iodidimonas gelatinilytica]|uniref:UTP--glucose-1-phosphate uridylyltransferase n=1 Tax=Iodidimonas gelatinilytica TaxID=1236966 RepID=A0A5A7N018_9PROT|nr:UTP--glucose-1-phosphate uridylyltransferase GalU [Iodidimonas gelatinilytica]GER01367.1 UTP--glucose-1-phosphate uridylyltransferase [Iodidimonas gelatinilytica]
MKARVRKAVMPVAGLGTRFLPATKAMPKEMLPVVDKPIIQYAVEEAFAAGIEEVIFITGRGKYLLEDHFDHAFELEATLTERGKDDALKTVRSIIPKAGGVSYTRQQKPLGLGHAVWCARNLVGDEPFAVLLPDDLVKSDVPCLQQMITAYEKTGGNLVAVMDVPREHTSRYGILDVGAVDGALSEVKGLVEKPKPQDAPSTLSIIGRYILQPDIFEALERKERGAGGEIQLTDAMARLIGHQPFHGLRFEGTRYDCGDKLGFLKATISLALEREDLGSDLADYLKSLSL